MHTISEVVELGEAHALILSERKCILVFDDAEPQSFHPQEFFDSVD